MSVGAVTTYLDAHEDRFVAELSEYLRFHSVSAQAKHKPDLEACATWLCEHCRAIGLDAELHPTAGNPVLVARTPRSGRSSKPHCVVYGHYDVQPPEPLELWTSPPFEPRIDGRSIFARGAADNKGQHMAHFNAVESYLRTGTTLPCDLTFVIEGEEEVGSVNFAPFLRQHRRALHCDCVVVSDTGMPGLQYPALTYGLRGVVPLEITLTGPKTDLHSGVYGGSVENPATALCQLLATLRDRNGRIAIPGFYDDVRPLTRYEREELARLPISAREYKEMLGVPALFGEPGYTHHERRTARPTFEINGLTSGYQGEGSKTIVPARASAKISMRLVPDQDPRRIQKLVVSHLKRLCPKTVRLDISVGHGADPYVIAPTGHTAQAALRALRSAFGCEPVLLREGASIPVVSEFKRTLGVDTLLLGLALPDDNIHSPNEKFSLDAFASGMRMSARLWQELASA